MSMLNNECQQIDVALSLTCSAGNSEAMFKLNNNHIGFSVIVHLLIYSIVLHMILLIRMTLIEYAPT